MRKTKKNGFVCPMHPYQYVSYFIIFFEMGVTTTLVGPMLEVPGQVRATQPVFFAFYAPLQFLVLVFGFLVTLSDPTDSVVYQHRSARANK